MELTFCAVMLSLFHSFGDHENEHEHENENDGDGEEEENDIDGSQGKTYTQKHGNSNHKLTVLSSSLFLILPS
jgi:hypothetical protein